MKFYAVYFIMGHYREDDKVPEEWIGRDCPFEDSPWLEAETVDGLRKLIDGMVEGTLCGPNYGTFHEEYPDAIFDANGNIRLDLYRDICGEELDPHHALYSAGRDSLQTLWHREKWRWFKTK